MMTPTVRIISDIHSNLEALTAVLADIATRGIDRIYCLGDIVGYGPNPCECVDIAMDFSVCLLGDHDKLACEGEAETPFAQRYVLWTRRQLGFANRDPNEPDRRRDFLRHLPKTHVEDGALFLHGSPRDPVNDYMFPEFVFDRRRMESILALVGRCCFMGHTHIPGVFTPDCAFLSPKQMNDVWHCDTTTKTLCNVGSVGQPRDNDDRACYCVYDGDTIKFRRVDYDWKTTARKIENMFPPD